MSTANGEVIIHVGRRFLDRVSTGVVSQGATRSDNQRRPTRREGCGWRTFTEAKRSMISLVVRLHLQDALAVDIRCLDGAPSVVQVQRRIERSRARADTKLVASETCVSNGLRGISS